MRGPLGVGMHWQTGLPPERPPGSQHEGPEEKTGWTKQPMWEAQELGVGGYTESTEGTEEGALGASQALHWDNGTKIPSRKTSCLPQARRLPLSTCHDAHRSLQIVLPRPCSPVLSSSSSQWPCCPSPQSPPSLMCPVQSHWPGRPGTDTFTCTTHHRHAGSPQCRSRWGVGLGLQQAPC